MTSVNLRSTCCVTLEKTTVEQHAGDSTILYYEDHAEEYVARTQALDLSSLYEIFLSLIPAKGVILDVGCGSGRDLRAFRERGFSAIGIEASRALVEIARRHSGATCLVRRFEEIDWRSCFDGVWACASLLHAPKAKLLAILRRLRDALKLGGVIYISVREGVGERVLPDGRYFSDYSADEFQRMISEAGGLLVLETWTTSDVAPEARDIRWLNFLLQR